MAALIGVPRPDVSNLRTPIRSLPLASAVPSFWNFTASAALVLTICVLLRRRNASAPLPVAVVTIAPLADAEIAATTAHKTMAAVKRRVFPVCIFFFLHGDGINSWTDTSSVRRLVQFLIVMP